MRGYAVDGAGGGLGTSMPTPGLTVQLLKGQ